MKKRFSDEQKVRIVAESRAHGGPVTAKKNGVSERSVYLWRRTLKGVQLLYSDPGEPWHNGSGESFNGPFRRGCLSRYEFRTLAEAKVFIEEWRRIYNEIRPHSRLGYRPPASAYFLEPYQAA